MSGELSQSFSAASIPESYGRFMLTQLFEPWAAELLSRAELEPGWSVLDVASGLGPVARLAAAAVGPSGRVVASDISGPMLTQAAAMPSVPGAAQLEFLECPAEVTGADPDSFDAVACQHGLQFFPERGAAVAEMRRVVRPRGVVVVSTWAAERPLGLFGAMGETLAELEVPEPYPAAYDPGSYRLAAEALGGMLSAAGFGEVMVQTVELDAYWPSADEAASTILGTPFGPLVTALPAAAQAEVRARLTRKLAGDGVGPVTVHTASNIARAVK